MEDRQRIRRQPNAVGAEHASVNNGGEHSERTEPLNKIEILDEGEVDRHYLARVLREGEHYLPAPKPRGRSKRTAKDSEKPWARGAKMVGLVLAVAVLTGSVIMASVLAEQRHNQAARDNRALPEINGAAALGGFAPSEPTPASGPSSSTSNSSSEDRSPDTSDVSEPPNSSGLPARPDSLGSTTSNHSRSRPAQTPSTQSSSGKPHSDAASDAAKVAAVKGFYARMDKDPEQALSLLDPLLTGDHGKDLVKSWGTISSLKVEDVQVQPDGSVRAVVVIDELSGGQVRITQLLKLTEGTTVKILDAWLLSAERLGSPRG